MKPTILQLHVSSKMGGGAEHVYLLTKDLLRQDRCRIVAVCPNNGPYFQRLRELGIKVIDLPVRTVSLRVFLGLMRVIRKEHIQLIHSHGKGAGLYSRPLGFITRIPVVHTFHGIHYRKYSRPVQRLYFMGERLLSKMTATVINVSESEQREGLQLKLFDRARSVVVRNGVDLESFDVPSHHTQRRELGIPEGWTIIGNVGRFDYPKGQEYLIRAIPYILEKCSAVKFLFIGDGELRASCEQLADRLGVKAYTLFLGFRDDVDALLKIIDIYVSPSLWEGLSLALLEAMACRKPIVATNVVGNDELITSNEDGVFVPPQDPVALAEKVLMLIADKDLGQKMGEAARRKVESCYSYTRMVEQTAQIYSEILGLPRENEGDGD